jgi:beta-mannosidase
MAASSSNDVVQAAVDAWAPLMGSFQKALFRCGATGSERRLHTFVEDIELSLDPSPIDVEVMQTDDGYVVKVTAQSFARDVTLLADRAAPDATVDDALITLTAGESTTSRVWTSARELEQALDRQPVLRTANDLQHTQSVVRRG